jgi:hypothetical protein
MSNRLSAMSMLMAWTVTPPCRRFIRRMRRGPIISHRTPGKRAKKNQQQSDFHFSSEKKPLFHHALKAHSLPYHRFYLWTPLHAGGFLPRIILRPDFDHASRAKEGWSDPARVVRNSPRAGPLLPG